MSMPSLTLNDDLGSDYSSYVRRKKLQDILTEAENTPSPVQQAQVQAPVHPFSSTPDQSPVQSPVQPPVQAPSLPSASVQTPAPTQDETPPVLPMPGQQAAPEPQNIPLGEMPKAVQPFAPPGESLATPPSYASSVKVPQSWEAYKAMVDRGAPTRADVPVSGWRKALSTMAGIGTGILTMNPFVGERMGKSIYNAPLQQKQQEYYQQLGEKGKVAKIDEDMMKFQADQAKEQAATEQARATVGAQGALERLHNIQADQAVKAVPKWEPRTEEEFKRAQEYQHPEKPEKAEPWVVRTKDGGEVPNAFLSRDDKGNPVFTYNGRVIPGDQIIGVSKASEADAQGKSAYSDQVKAAVKRLGRPLTEEELTAKHKLVSEEGRKPQDPESAALNLELKRTQLEIAKGRLEDQGSKREAAAKGAIPGAISIGQNWRSYFDPNKSKEEKAAAGRLWQKGTGLPPPSKPSGRAQTFDDTALISLGHIRNLREIFRANPELWDYVGPIMGRVGKLGQNVGTDMSGIPDNLKSVAQQIRTQLNYFIVQEASTVSGGRTGKYLLDNLAHVSPDTRMEKDMFLGALNGAENSAKLASNAMLNSVYGPGVGTVEHTYKGKDGKEHKEEIPRISMQMSGPGSTPVIGKYDPAKKRYVPIDWDAAASGE